MVIDIMLKLHDNNVYCAGYEQLFGTWLLLWVCVSSTAFFEWHLLYKVLRAFPFKTGWILICDGSSYI